MALIDTVKEHMRISPANTKLDNEISSNIEAALADLALVGIDVSNPEDKPLIVSAVKLYCDCHVGYRSDADRYEGTYEKLKATLSLAKAVRSQ